jgi:ABC-type transport system substrate-binding protein
MICSGPFRLRSRLPYDSIIIERNPLYYDAGQVALSDVWLARLPRISVSTNCRPARMKAIGRSLDGRQKRS